MSSQGCIKPVTNARAFADFALDANVAAMQPRDLPAEREPQPRAARARVRALSAFVKRLERMGKLFLRHAASAVRHVKSIWMERHADRRFPARALSVHHQIAQQQDGQLAFADERRALSLKPNAVKHAQRLSAIARESNVVHPAARA